MTLRLYVPAPLHAGAALELPAGAARHVQVRRAQPGDALILFDGQGGEWQAEVTQMGRQQVTVRVGAHAPANREPVLAVTLAVGMPANDRMDWLVEKATELGVHAIQPLVTERGVLRLSGDRAERKQAHWQGIAIAAAEQSGRTRVPAVAPVLPLAAWLLDGHAARSGHRCWVLSPQADVAADHAGRAGQARPLTALTGPEGGLSPDELAQAVAHGFEARSLGPRVLRADTAPIALLARLTLDGC